MARINVGVLGATGVVGQKYVELLDKHPWFEVTHVAASERSASVKYSEAISGRRHISAKISPSIENLKVEVVGNVEAAKKNCSFVFSALDTESAKIHEIQYAAAGIPVVSNASAYRKTNDIPLIIPEINPEHLDIIPLQQENRGWKNGFIVVKPNCSIQSYMIPLYALHQRFKVRKVIVSTMQAVSGAGYPGVSSTDIIDNIVPYIKGEEEKSENEPLKIFGTIANNTIVPNNEMLFSTHCNRVPVIDGHMACVSVEFEEKPFLEEIIKLWKDFRGIPQQLDLPSAPVQPITLFEEVDRPQPRIDRLIENGMAIAVGRLRNCNIFHCRFVGLHHNSIRGAAGGGILNAELLVSKGYIKNAS